MSTPPSLVRRRTFLLQSTALLIAAAAGCASQKQQAPSSDAAKLGRLTIDFWNGFTGPDGKTMEAMVRRFEAANPDIVVRMQIIAWGTYYDKLTLALAYGGAPDLFVCHAGRLPEFAQFGVLRSLDDLYASDAAPLTERDFAPVPWQATFFEGKHLALPLDVHPLGLYYNTRLFEQAGIVDKQGKAKPPTDWDEFLGAAKRLTRDTDSDGRIDQWGFVFTWQRTNFLTFAAQFGGGMLTPDYRASVMDSPANREAARRMHDLIYRYHVAPRPEGVDAWLAFRQGKVGMALEGIYQLSSLEEQKDLAFAGAPAPQFGPKPGVWGGSHLLCQPANGDGERARAAWRLMRYLSDNSIAWAKGGQVPARLSVLHSPEFAALPVQSAFARQIDYVQYEPLSPDTNALFPFVDPAVEAILLDLQSPEEALSEANRRINQVLTRQ